MEQITMVKSDREQVIDLVTTLIGLAVLAYTLDPEPFDRIFDTLRERFNGWTHKLSVRAALHEIRSLDETDEPQ